LKNDKLSPSGFRRTDRKSNVERTSGGEKSKIQYGIEKMKGDFA
jgi:hypothetical protein